MSKVVLKGHIVVADADLGVVKNELATHIDLTLNEDGCLVFSVVQDKANENKFFVYEEFTDQDSFASHQERVGGSRWGNVTKNAERHYQIAVIDE